MPPLSRPFVYECLAEAAAAGAKEAWPARGPPAGECALLAGAHMLDAGEKGCVCLQAGLGQRAFRNAGTRMPPADGKGLRGYG
jgi:hypothetical protein